MEKDPLDEVLMLAAAHARRYPIKEKEWPKPIPIEDIRYTLPREKFLPPMPSDAECLRRFKALPYGARWIEDMHGGEYEKYLTWDRCWRDQPYEVLAQMFSFGELLRLWLKSVVQSDLGDYFEKEHPLLWKIQNCQWQYGSGRDYNAIVAAVEGLQRISLGLPDFEARVIHTRGSNTHAWAEHIRTVYLDAAMGLAIYYKGKHVMTTGFAFAGEGVLVAQVQLVEKKGNRFLYHLPKHYVDLVLDIFRRAFPRQTLWLVTGDSATNAVRRAYKGTDRVLSEETSARMIALYNRPLEEFDRTEPLPYQREWRSYVRLRPKVAAMKPLVSKQKVA